MATAVPPPRIAALIDAGRKSPGRHRRAKAGNQRAAAADRPYSSSAFTTGGESAFHAATARKGVYSLLSFGRPGLGARLDTPDDLRALVSITLRYQVFRMFA